MLIEVADKHYLMPANGKQCKKDDLNARRKKQRLEKLARDGRLANGVEMPRGGIVADLTQQSASGLSQRNYYRDIDFTCVDCGKVDVWTAKDQKWYFEVVKAPVYSQPKRCAECREKDRSKKDDQRTRMEVAEQTRQQNKQN